MKLTWRDVLGAGLLALVLAIFVIVLVVGAIPAWPCAWRIVAGARHTSQGPVVFLVAASCW